MKLTSTRMSSGVRFGCNLLFLSEEYIWFFINNMQQCHHWFFYLLLGSLRGCDEIMEVSHHRIVLLQFCYSRFGVISNHSTSEILLTVKLTLSLPKEFKLILNRLKFFFFRCDDWGEGLLSLLELQSFFIELVHTALKHFIFHLAFFYLNSNLITNRK